MIYNIKLTLNPPSAGVPCAVGVASGELVVAVKVRQAASPEQDGTHRQGRSADEPICCITEEHLLFVKMLTCVLVHKSKNISLR